MPNGGKRKGAGRPIGSKAPHTIETEALRAYFISRVIAEKEPIITALIDKAKNGDVSAAKELLERSLILADINVLPKAKHHQDNDGALLWLNSLMVTKVTMVTKLHVP